MSGDRVAVAEKRAARLLLYIKIVVVLLALATLANILLLLHRFNII